MARDVQDFYFRQARSEGYRSRAAYKLIEIDDRRHVLHSGDCVLDCGAAPGSWLQVAAERVGPKGMVLGIDLLPIDPVAGADNVIIMQGDVRTVESQDLLSHLPARHQRFDIVLSDMAPKTRGDRSGDHFRSVQLCDAVLERIDDLLAEGGRLVMKVLEGEAYGDLLGRVKHRFRKVKGFKPKASRDESTEMYIIAHDFLLNSKSSRGPAERDQTPDHHGPNQLPPGPKPSGWGR